MGKQNPNEMIMDQDRTKRLQAEADIIRKAKELANGSHDDVKLRGEVTVWQIETLIDHSTLMRNIVDSLTLYQLKTDCEAAHRAKSWPLKLFGITFSAPINIVIMVIAFFVYQYCRKEGWL